MCKWSHPTSELNWSHGRVSLAPVALQLCTPALADSLNILKKRKKQYLRKRRRRERYKALRTVREHQSKACKTRPGPHSGPSHVRQKPAAAAQPHFSGSQITESVVMLFRFLFASFRIKSSLQAGPEPTKCLMTWSQSSLAALLRMTSLNVCTVPKANWSSWWRTSTTAPPPKHLSQLDGQRSRNQPHRTAASTVPRRCSATSGETQHTRHSSVSTSFTSPPSLLTQLKLPVISQV